MNWSPLSRAVPRLVMEKSAVLGREAGTSIQTVIYPRFCMICEKDLPADQHLLCDRCWSGLEMTEGPFCGRCDARPAVGNQGCARCQGKSRFHSMVRSAYVYHDDVRKIIHAFKFQRKIGLAKRLGRTLAFVCVAEPWFAAVQALVPVPLHPSRLRERGYNQSDLLADVMADETGLPCLKDVLVRRKKTKAMTALVPEKRPGNVEGAFQVIRPGSIFGRTVALVDDVYTTGATTRACANILRQAGALDVVTVTVARA